jgi:hypothetical protein
MFGSNRCGHVFRSVAFFQCAATESEARSEKHCPDGESFVVRSQRVSRPERNAESALREIKKIPMQQQGQENPAAVNSARHP